MWALPSPLGHIVVISPSGKASSLREVASPLDSLPGAMRAWDCDRDPSVSYDFIGLGELALSGAVGFYGLRRGASCSSIRADSPRSSVGLIDHDACSLRLSQ